MNENSASIAQGDQVQTSIFESPYEKEVQLDIWQHERKKTMQSIFAVGLILLISNLIGFATANILDVDHLFDILLIPVIILGLGFFARLQPMVSAISVIVVILAVTVINYISFGPATLIAGWLYKVFALYFIIRSVQQSKDAEGAKKNLAELN